MEKKDAVGPVKPPPGLQAIINECLKIYPDQPNPLQVATVVKYWLGGQDPLDYISMYKNDGDVELNVPPHWHYVTFGLSDLHGDGRVHVTENIENPEQRSGMGFELTFRLIHKPSADSNEDLPPIWPANLLQQLAKYVFQSGNRLCAGDNIPWKKSLSSESSQIQHMLVAEDPQLRSFRSAFGLVDFCQIVGVTEDELNQATWWKGLGILMLLRKDPQTGGRWLLTDMDRSQSVFELFPKTLNDLKYSLDIDGSDLAGINASFTFKEVQRTRENTDVDQELMNARMQMQQMTDNVDAPAPVKDEAANNARFFEAMSISNSLDKSAMSIIRSEMMCQPKAVPLEGIELCIGPDCAKYLVLAIKDRIRHGRHFTLKNEFFALTFVSELVTGDGVVVTKKSPYALYGYWIQVLIAEELIPDMVEKFLPLMKANGKFDLPLRFEWPAKHLSIVIDNIEPLALPLPQK